MTIQFWLTIDPCSASNRLIPPEQMRRTLNLSGIQQDDPSLLISLHHRQTPSVDMSVQRACMCSCWSACVHLEVEGLFPIDERPAKNTIHYHPLRAISFPTTLLSETILFIDGKINPLREGGRADN